jgi:hypothetical protein
MFCAFSVLVMRWGVFPSGGRIIAPWTFFALGTNLQILFADVTVYAYQICHKWQFGKESMVP